MQKYTSEKTSINTVNKVYTAMNFATNSRILDYGGGKYDSNITYMQEKGCQVYVYDKYNRSKEHNEHVLQEMTRLTPNYIVCSNVLNVIYEDEIIDEILKDIAQYKTATVFIAIYEGDKKGIGKETNKGWQRNEKTTSYIPKIEKYFNVIKKKGNIIECKSKEDK